MTDKEKQELATPEPGQEQAEPTEAPMNSDSAPTPQPKASQKMAIFALILAVAALLWGYMKWGELDTALQQEREALADLKKQQQEAKGRLDKSAKAISEQQTAFAEQEARLKVQTDEMQQSLDLVYERVGRSSAQWIVAEAEYLMRIANHRLQLEGDSSTALVALTRADKRLHDSGDPAWTAVREKLAAEIVELKALGQLDLTGETAKITGLISQVDKLRLPHFAPAADEPAEDGIKKDEKEFSVSGVLNDLWSGLKSLLKVRHNDRPVATMLEPDQRFFLYQNLRLQLEAARLALLRRDQALFDAGLQRVEAWIKEFFDQESAATRGMLQEIKGLKNLELEAKMPDISGSLHMLLKQQGQVVDEPEVAETDQAQPEEVREQITQEPKDTNQEEAKVEVGTEQTDQGEIAPDQGQGEDESGQKVTP